MNQITAGDTVSVGDITAILLRRKWQILAVFVLVAGSVAAFTLCMPKQYESHMKILVKNERADMIVSAGRGEGSDYRGEVSETEINSEIELLDSTNLLQRVVAKCGLDKTKDKTQPASPGSDAGAIALERATARLQKALTIAPVRKANIIQVDYISPDPRQAAAVLRQLADLYLEEHLKVHGSPGTYQFFASQAEQYQNELKDAESKLEAFRQKNNIVMLAQQKDVMLQKASESEAALMQADASIGEYSYRVADTRRQLAAAPDRITTQNRTVPNQYSVDHINSTLVDLQNKRTQLLAKFRPDDRMVLEADKEIADTQAALDKAAKATATEQSTDINPVHQTLAIDIAKQQSELAGVQARRQTLAGQVHTYRGQLMALGNATAEYDDLTRTQKTAEENYLLYEKKAEESRIAESLDRQKIANVAIAEPPTEPYLPSKPNVRLNLTLGVLLAGFLSLGIAFGAEYLNQPKPKVQLAEGHLLGPIEERAELETLTGLPVLATIILTRRN